MIVLLSLPWDSLWQCQALHSISGTQGCSLHRYLPVCACVDGRKGWKEWGTQLSTPLPSTSNLHVMRCMKIFWLSPITAPLWFWCSWTKPPSLLLTSWVAGHCLANSACDDEHKPCAEVINVLQWRLEIWFCAPACTFNSKDIQIQLHHLKPHLIKSESAARTCWLPETMPCKEIVAMVVCQPVSQHSAPAPARTWGC